MLFKPFPRLIRSQNPFAPAAPMKQALRSASRRMRLGVRRTEFCSPVCHVAVDVSSLVSTNGLCSALFAVSRTETPGPARPSHMARDPAPSCPVLQQASGDSCPPGTSSPPQGTYCSRDTVTDLCVLSCREWGLAPQGKHCGEGLPA